MVSAKLANFSRLSEMIFYKVYYICILIYFLRKKLIKSLLTKLIFVQIRNENHNCIVRSNLNVSYTMTYNR